MLRTVPIQLDRARNLKYDLNAYVVLQERHGINMFEPTERAESPVMVRAILWAGLVHEDPTLTLERVGEWVDLGNYAEVSRCLAEAMLQSRKQRVESGDEPAPFPVAAGPTSASSTSSA